MSSTSLRTIQRRDAAVTAALAGGVLVILGYASGLGIKQPAAATATVTPSPSPAAVAPIETPAPPQAVPVQDAAAPAAVVVPPAPGASRPTIHPAPPAALPSAPIEPAPAAPPPAEPTCPPGLVSEAVSGLPVVPGVLSLVSDLLTTPLVGESGAGPGAPAPADDPVTCALGSLVGTTCCASGTAARVAVSPAP